VDVLNGIAWDRARDRVLVTGKYRPRLYELRSRVRTPA
jgi:glutamine cyclotransferase